MKRLLYWFFLISPILLHIVINLSFWCHLPAHYISKHFWCHITYLEELNKEFDVNFLYYIKFLWFLPVYWVFLNLGGVLYGLPKDSNKNYTSEVWSTPNILLIVSYVSKGINQDALFRAMRETRKALDSRNVKYTIEVVTDNRVTRKKIISPTKGPIIYYVVPENYPTNVKYKARALQYLLEQRKERLDKQKEWNPKDVWVLHLDEESILTSYAIMGIENFINKHNLHNGDGAIGQGEILYNSYKYGKNLLITAADALRTGDDLGRFRFQYKVLHRPISGVHGSFLLVPALIEQELTWNLATRGLLTEDIYFAFKAWEKKIRFDWVEGFIREQSPFTFKDFLNQRSRWYQGLVTTITDNRLKLFPRFVLGFTIFSWSICWLGTVVTIINIIASVFVRQVDFLYFPSRAIISASILAGFVGSIYMIGAFRNVLHWTAPLGKKIGVLLITYLLFIIQLVPLMEGIAIIRSIAGLLIMKIRRKPQEFYIVAKD